MLVLGWHGGMGLAETERTMADRYLLDAAAVLLRDGVVVAAAREERFDRVRHSGAFPANSISHCLRQAGIGLDALDAIVTDRSRESVAELLFHEVLNDPRLPNIDPEAWIENLFQRHLGGTAAGRVVFCDATEAWLSVGQAMMRDVPSVVAYFGGEDATTVGAIASCAATRISILTRFQAEQSLSALTSWSEAALGLPPFCTDVVAELAASGDPRRFEPVLDRLYRLTEGGGFVLTSENERLAALIQAGLADRLHRVGTPWRQLDRDFAAAVHAALERIVGHVLGHFQTATGLDDLCLVGPLADDAALIGKLAGASLYARIHTFPLADAAGAALGAAQWASRPVERADVAPPCDYSLGSDIGSAETIGARLAQWSAVISARRLSNVVQESARLLARGWMIGWAQGCSELLRRPLGNRAILKAPAGEGVARGQGGQMDRRFTVVVPKTKATDYFLLPPALSQTGFNARAFGVVAAHHALLDTALLGDGTARVRLVGGDVVARFRDLLDAFGELTGLPLLFEAPLGNDGEPPAETVDDAVACLLAGDLDALVIGDWLVERTPSFCPAACVDLVASLPPGRRLTRWRGPHGSWLAFIDGIGGDPFSGPQIGISPALARVLARPEAAIPHHQAILGPELHDLWRRRAVTLVPA